MNQWAPGADEFQANSRGGSKVTLSPSAARVLCSFLFPLEGWEGVRLEEEHWIEKTRFRH